MECLSNRLGNLIRISDQETMFGDRHRDPTNIGFLKCIGTNCGAGDLSRDSNHGDRIHVGISDGCDQVGCARSTCRHADSNPTGCTGITLGSVTCTLLMSDQNVANLGGVHHGVISRQNCPTRNAKNYLDTGRLQG